MPINTIKIPYQDLTNLKIDHYASVNDDELEDAYQNQQQQFQTKLNQIKKYQEQLNQFSSNRTDFETQFQNVNNLQYLNKKLKLKIYYEQCLYHIFTDAFVTTIDSIVFENVETLQSFCDHELTTQINVWIANHLTDIALDQILQGVVNLQSWDLYDFVDFANFNAHTIKHIIDTDPEITKDSDIEATFYWLFSLANLFETIETHIDQQYQILSDPNILGFRIQSDLTIKDIAS